jgi:exosortase/archaeosortase family protein
LAKSKFEELLFKMKNYIVSENKKIRSNEKKQLIYFLGGFVLFYLVISLLVGLVPQEVYKEITGNVVQGILSLEGINTISLGFLECNEFSWLSEGIKGTCYAFNIADKTIFIAWLCTGILEIIILISAILASFGIKQKEKLVGVILAIIVGVIFNILRIIITIHIVLTQNLQIVEFAHDILFKVILFVYITVFYVIWFYWAMRK